MYIAVYHKLSCSNFSNIRLGCGASIKLSQESDIFVAPDHAVSKSFLLFSPCIRANNAQAVVPFAHTRSANRQPSSSSFMGKWQCQRIVKSAACVKHKFANQRFPAPIIALIRRQAEYLGALLTSEQVFVFGPAGTGKTWLAATYAADLYPTRDYQQDYSHASKCALRPFAWFFPRFSGKKFAPWAVPVSDAIRDRLGDAAYDIAVKNGDIEVIPFEVMRGRSWRDTFVILDEAQNASVAEIKCS